MSYILDALKRSERERNQAETPAPIVATGAPEAARRGWLVPAVGLGLLANALVLGWALWPRAEAPAPAVTTTDEPSLAEIARVGGRTLEPPLADVTTARAEPPKTLSGEPATATASHPQPAPSPQFAPVGAPDAAGRHTASHAANDAPRRPVTAATSRPAASPPPSQAAERISPGVAIAAAPIDERVPQLFELPVAVRSRVPPVNISVHVYAEEPAARWVLVNLKRAREGEPLPNGLRLERITPDGVVMDFEGQRFQLSVGP